MKVTWHELTKEARIEREDFNFHFFDKGCTCFKSAPCSYCTDPGNPLNQAEGGDETWEEFSVEVDSPPAGYEIITTGTWQDGDMFWAAHYNVWRAQDWRGSIKIEGKYCPAARPISKTTVKFAAYPDYGEW